MGTFVGHIVPGLAFTLLGLWQTINTIKAFKIRGPTNFISRFWYPFSISNFTFKHLELLTIFSFSMLAIAMQILDYPVFHLSFKPNNFEHATMFLHLAIYSGVALAVDLSHLSDAYSGLIGILASSVFAQELLLLHFHSADHVGLEGHYHWLLQLIVSISLASTVATTTFPSSFAAALLRSASILLQGCWFIDMGFMLWVPRLVAKGCYVRFQADDDVHGAVYCGTPEAKERAMALANLQFCWISAGIMIFAAFLCLSTVQKSSKGGLFTDYEKLSCSRSQDGGQTSTEVDGFKQLNLGVV